MPIIASCIHKIGPILSHYHYKLNLQIKSTLSISEFSSGCASEYIFLRTFTVICILNSYTTEIKLNKSLKQVFSSLIALKVHLLHGNTS